MGDGAGPYDGAVVAVGDVFGREDGRDAAPAAPPCVVGCDGVVRRGAGDASVAGVDPPRVRKPGPSHAHTAANAAITASLTTTNKAL